jgi:hypothetical protein
MNTIGIPIAFILLSSVLLWFVIGSKGNWFIKACAIALTLSFSLVLWNSLTSLEGWPAEQQLPEKFVLHWAVIREGSKENKEDGQIYLWIKNLKETGKDFSLISNKDMENDPRVYKIPYSRKTHEQLQKALEGIKKGKTFIGENKNGQIGNADKGQGQGKGKDAGSKGKGKGMPGKDGRSGKGGDFSFSQEQDLVFYELPPAIIPRKIIDDQQSDPFATPPVAPPVTPPVAPPVVIENEN